MWFLEWTFIIPYIYQWKGRKMDNESFRILVENYLKFFLSQIRFLRENRKINQNNFFPKAKKGVSTRLPLKRLKKKSSGLFVGTFFTFRIGVLRAHYFSISPIEHKLDKIVSSWAWERRGGGGRRGEGEEIIILWNLMPRVRWKRI